MERDNTKLRTAISLFSGAGGLDFGLVTAGFNVRLCVENDPTCRETIAANGHGWTLANPGDVHELSPQDALTQAGLQRGEVDLLAGGPPCQPFSKAGYWARGETRRLTDPRAKTLEAYLGYVRCFLPEVILLENVTGLAYSKKDEGVRLLRDGLREINAAEGSLYEPIVLKLNAASYGVPQLRERVFVIAHRNARPISAPPVTHMDPDQLTDELRRSGIKRYRTAWDAIGDLEGESVEEALEPRGKWGKLLGSVPEGKNYLWHTPRGGGAPLFGWRTRYWSFLLKLAKDKPSWTIPAQPGPATGPFHWKSRLLSARELCRLQTFPDTYEVGGSYRDIQRQIGNAVPPAIGELLGLEIRKQLFGEAMVSRDLRLIPPARGNAPPPEPVHPVPDRYLDLCSEHKEHPGTGMGPGARRRANVIPGGQTQKVEY